jgi:molybdopterin-containing oxidoreductase family iron-sulfur binding subunit
VGKDQVARAREMHWLKIDQYYLGDNLENPELMFQPRMCQHCEQAPCEVVCPVAATIHDAEGLNVMVYNRCVGTKYCSNNCPYKVRRFNFFQYSNKDIPVLQLVHNPEVTVRDRGVMEKCTYCVQRISAARIVAERENRPIADGEVRTACQQACPTGAITFGNLNDTASQVIKLHELPGNYSLLEELGTKPRTTYLPRVRNPNPELEDRR